jgi:hypothetical protein
MFLAGAELINRETLIARYETEMEPYLAGRNSDVASDNAEDVDRCLLARIEMVDRAQLRSLLLGRGVVHFPRVAPATTSTPTE